MRLHVAQHILKDNIASPTLCGFCGNQQEKGGQTLQGAKHMWLQLSIQFEICKKVVKKNAMLQQTDLLSFSIQKCEMYESHLDL